MSIMLRVMRFFFFLERKGTRRNWRSCRVRLLGSGSRVPSLILQPKEARALLLICLARLW